MAALTRRAALLAGLALVLYRYRLKAQKAILHLVYRLRVFQLKLGLGKVDLEKLYGNLADTSRKASPEMNAINELFADAGRGSKPQASWKETVDGMAGFYDMGFLGPLFSSEQVRKVKIEGVSCAWITHPDTKTTDESPIIVYCHGGGYFAGNLATYASPCGEISRRTGCRVVFVDYTLCPNGTIANARDEIVRVYEYLLKSTVSSKIALAGDSAGGGFVMGVLQGIRANNLAMPACGVMLSPWGDISNESSEYKDNNCDALFPHVEFFETLAEKAVEISGKDAAHPDNSFLNGGFKYFPPIMVTCGEPERLLGDTKLFIERAKADGVKVTVDLEPYGAHIYPIMTGYGVPEYNACLDRMCKFFKTNLE